jgi:gamma-glutamylcyclotransferase (GGCT)/AIG2-like uncharacterized protein YtfP
MKKVLYFAYGRNMLADAIYWRVGKTKKTGTLTLTGYKLVFNTGKSITYANIVKGSDTDKVEGVLYELNDHQIEMLDRYEGYPNNYQKRYFTNENNEIIFAYVSRDSWYETDKLPQRSYVMDLYNGAKENNLEFTRELLKNYLADVLKKPLKAKRKWIDL